MSVAFWSDLCGLASGIALLVTAWRNDGLYGYVEKLRNAVDAARKTPLASSPREPDKLAGAVIEALHGELSRWSWVDRWSLRAGAGLLILSYLLKLVSK